MEHGFLFLTLDQNDFKLFFKLPSTVGSNGAGSAIKGGAGGMRTANIVFIVEYIDIIIIEISKGNNQLMMLPFIKTVREEIDSTQTVNNEY